MHAADELIAGLEKHPVIGVFGDCATRRQRGQPSPAPTAQDTVDCVMMDQCAAPAPLCAEAFGKH
jgi:hypothetical protein